MDFLNQLFGDINSVLWGVFVLIPLLCGTGIFYTFKSSFRADPPLSDRSSLFI